MEQLFTQLVESIKPYIPSLIGLAISLLISLWLAKIGLTALIKLGQRWAGYEYPVLVNKKGKRRSRLFIPSSWLKIEPKQHFEAKGKMLANEAIRETYAPAASPRYTRDLKDKERAWKLAWLSPFPEAVKASIRDAPTPKGKKLEARKQIKDVAAQIEIKSLPEGMNVGGDREDHFQVLLAHDGRKASDIEKLEENIKSQLALDGGIEKYPLGSASTRTVFIAHKQPFIDPLTELGKDVAWLRQNPAKSPYSLPVAIKEDGGIWTFATQNTVCLGEIGSGKGSFLLSFLFQIAPFVREGVVKLHGIDPKAADLKVFKEIPGLFETVVYDPEPASQMIAGLKEEMDHRMRGLGIDEDNLDAKRKIKASKQTPLNIVVIDELWDLLDDIGTGPKSTAYTNLNSLGRKGRAPGFLIVAATQSVEQAVMGNLRKHFVGKVCMRQDSIPFNDFMLGSGAAERGYNSLAIPQANEENDYATAGIAYARKTAGPPERIRFAFADDSDAIPLAQSFRDGKKQTKLLSPHGGVIQMEEKDEGGFAFTHQDETRPPRTT